jgi:primosomal replication protein N
LRKALNKVQLSGVISQKSPLRYTAAGLPHAEAVLTVEQPASTVAALEVQVVAFEGQASRLSAAPVGAQCQVTGKLQRQSLRSAKLNVLIETIELI